MEITSVKIQSNGWLLNGNMSVPDASGNREREAIITWLLEGNTPEPEFTDKELLVQAKATKIAEAKAYLASTDYMMTSDYDKDTTEVRILRQQARDTVRGV
jgi:hypothetical protein